MTPEKAKAYPATDDEWRKYLAKKKHRRPHRPSEQPSQIGTNSLFADDAKHPHGLTAGVGPTTVLERRFPVPRMTDEVRKAFNDFELERSRERGQEFYAAHKASLDRAEETRAISSGEGREEAGAKWRELPAVRFSDVEEGWGGVVAAGWDTVVESFNLAITEADYARLDVFKGVAAEKGDAGREELLWGGEILQMWGYGAKGSRGFRFWIANDDFSVGIRAEGMGWPVSVRYSAGGLWEHGVWALRGRVIAALLSQFQPVGPREEDWSRVSEAHWATDVWSEAFSNEMRARLVEQVLCHSSSKKVGDFDKGTSEKIEVWGRGPYLETLTIAKRGQCVVQIYDKCKEITEASGKTWMVDLWVRDGGFEPTEKGPKDVWRVETRFRSEFLRKRGVVTVADLLEHRQALVTEALIKRRLTSVDESDSNKWRWPVHPLWVLVLDHLGRSDSALPMGEQVTGAGDAIELQLLKQIAGLARACSVLRVGDWDEVYLASLIDRVKQVVADDVDHEKKVEIVQARYKYVNCAR